MGYTVYCHCQKHRVHRIDIVNFIGYGSRISVATRENVFLTRENTESQKTIIDPIYYRKNSRRDVIKLHGN